MSLVTKIRRGQGPVWGSLKRLARGALHAHLPVNGLTRPFFGLLYHTHVFLRESLIWGLRFFWYEPLFRSQCVAVGAHFQMEKLPYLAGRGRIVIGERVWLSGKSSFGFNNRLHDRPELVVGDGTFIGHDCSFSVAESVHIGKHCLLAGGVSVRDYDGHPVDAAQRRSGRPVAPDEVKPVVIGDDVWVGEGALVMKGVTVGDRSIIGAGSIVTKDVPADTVVAGNPARVVKGLADLKEVV